MCAECLQFRPHGQRPRQILGVKGKFFHTDKVQVRRCGSGLLPKLPGRKKIQPGTKACLTNGEYRIFRQRRPTLRQVILREKNVAGFFQSRSGRKIDIVKRAGHRLAVVAPLQLRMGDGLAVGLVLIVHIIERHSSALSKPNSPMICAHHWSRRSSLRSNSFSSSSASPTKCRPSGVSPLDSSNT